MTDPTYAEHTAARRRGPTVAIAVAVGLLVVLPMLVVGSLFAWQALSDNPFAEELIPTSWELESEQALYGPKCYTSLSVCNEVIREYTGVPSQDAAFRELAILANEHGWEHSVVESVDPPVFVAERGKESLLVRVGDSGPGTARVEYGKGV